RHRVEAPQELAGLGIVSRNVTSNTKLRTAVADQHPAFDDARRAGDGVRLRLIDSDNRPEGLTGRGFQGHEPPVERADIDAAFVNGDAAVDDVATGALPERPRHFWIVFPEQTARPRIKRIDDAPAPCSVNYTINDDGRCFESARRFGVVGPGETEPFNILCVD